MKSVFTVMNFCLSRTENDVAMVNGVGQFLEEKPHPGLIHESQTLQNNLTWTSGKAYKNIK